VYIGQKQTNRLTAVDELDVVVEADGHVTAHPEMTFPYMDDEFNDVKEFYDKSPSAGLENSPLYVASPIYVYEYMKMREGKDASPLGPPSGAEELQEAMNEPNVDKAIANNLGAVPNRTPRHSKAVANAYNNWFIEEFEGYPNIYGNLVLTPLDPEFAAREIQRIGNEDSVVGAQFLGTLLVNPLPHHPQYDPVWEAAETADIPINIHTGTGAYAFPRQFHWSETYAEDHVSAHPMQHISLLTSLVFGGVFERYPGLNIVMQEAGIGYIPPLLKRLDDIYRDIGYDLPDVHKRPSEYIRDSVYFCTQPLGHTAENPEHIARLIKMIGTDNVMWFADIPHPDFDTPTELSDRIKSNFAPDEINKIMGKNAEKLMGI
jgi:predicted TIM-barrel fold metal-dependent hydrolase